jgi:tetratricopeptide (TPR) repeat protein
MKLKIITTVSDNTNANLQKLSQSLIGWDFKIIHNPNIGWDWGGWDNHYQWLCSDEAKEYTHVIYTDGFDTLALGDQKEAEEKLAKLLESNPNAFIYSVEKHWFPWEGTDVAPLDCLVYKAKFDEKTKHLTENQRWRYANGGQYAGSIEAVKNWYEQAKIACVQGRTKEGQRNNQAYANAFYAEDTENRLILDFNCELFQTLSHSGVNHGSPEEFTVEGRRLINNLTGSKPCFVHNNGIKNPTEAQFMYDISLT